MQSFFDDMYSFCDGFLEIRTLPDRQQQYYQVGQIDTIKAYVESKVNQKQDVYFGVATRDGHGGAKKNVIEIPAVWIDIDFKNNPEDEASKLIKNGPIIPSFVVRSGGGFHVYWKLSEPYGPDSIQDVEQVMSRLVSYYKADGAATDASRILRVPGTKNFKPEYATPRDVTVTKLSGQTYDLMDFVDAYPDVKRGDVIHFPQYKDPTHELNAIMSCEFMKYCQNKASSITEPQWLAMISQLAGKKGGADLIHHLSKPYPGYSKFETDQKIIHSINNAGPWTCQKIKNIWDGECHCDVKSPASIPYMRLDGDNVTHVTPVTSCHDLSHNVTFGNYGYGGKFEGNLTEAIKEYIEESTGYFSGTDVDRELGIPSSQAVTRRKILSRLYKDRIIKKDRNNKYIKNNVKLDFISLSKNNDETFKIKLPAGLGDLVTLPEKSIMIVAGSSNAGKTAFLLNLLKANLKTEKELCYFMSEMGPQEYSKRVRGVCTDETDWKLWDRKVKAADLSTDYAAAVSTYASDGISVIDYLEDVDGEYFKIPAAIRNVYDSLDKGVAVIALQKHTESEFGRGGQGTTEKARLYVTIDKVTEDDEASMVSLRIIKAKSYNDRNPNGKEKHLRIIRGSRMEVLSNWIYVKDKATREAMFERYKHESEGDRRVRLLEAM